MTKTKVSIFWKKEEGKFFAVDGLLLPDEGMGLAVTPAYRLSGSGQPPKIVRGRFFVTAVKWGLRLGQYPLSRQEALQLMSELYKIEGINWLRLPSIKAKTSEVLALLEKRGVVTKTYDNHDTRTAAAF